MECMLFGVATDGDKKKRRYSGRTITHISKKKKKKKANGLRSRELN